MDIMMAFCLLDSNSRVFRFRGSWLYLNRLRLPFFRRRQLLLNSPPDFGDQPISISPTNVLGGYGIAKVNQHSLRPNPEPLFGQNRKSAAEANGNNGALGFDGKVKTSFFEGLKRAVYSPGALRENDNGSPLAYPGCCQIKAPEGLSAVTSVNGDVASALHAHPEKGKPKKLFFGEPAKLDGEMGEEREDVKLALVIGRKHVSLVGVDVLQPLHSDLHTTCKQHNPAPESTDEVGKIAPTAYKGENHGGSTTKDGSEKQDNIE
jgi:hypothetical protein